MGSLLIHNIGVLATPLYKDRDEFSRPVSEIRDAAILIEGGLISQIGKSKELEQAVDDEVARLDAEGALAVPGLIDCHAHPVFVGNRAREFHQRNAGQSYQEIAAAGGGIQASARKVREASVEQIVKESLPRFDRSLACGVTTIEAKSGYGLDWENEAKLLRALELISGDIPQRVSRTLLIHAVPEARAGDRHRFVSEICSEWIPRVAEEQSAATVDVFCETGAFTVDESRTILRRAIDCGLQATIHANQFGHSGGALLAAELGARSADHLEFLSAEEIKAMSAAHIPGVILPACVFFLGSIPYAPARAMIENGMRVAIASDMNPGSSMTESIPFCLTAAAVHGHLTPHELLWGATLDAARVLGCDHARGSLEVGRQGDIGLWKIPDLESLSYYFGDLRASHTIIGGELAWEDRDAVARF